MIAFDTNVLLRLLLDDEETQSRQVEALVRQVGEAGDRILLPDIVLCELYVGVAVRLRSSRRRISLRRSSAFWLRRSSRSWTSRAVSQSLESYESGPADFSDYLIGRSATVAGATTTYTFDRALRRTVGFSHPAPVR